ncbi:TOBE domain-containing protein [Arthrobacter sp. JCM 19049]|nr:TOBE domain-containing protein [Arthrobacter sp. JCM 19049]
MHIAATPDAVESGANLLSGTIKDASFTGTTTEYLVQVEGIGLLGTFSQNRGQQPGDVGERVYLSWDPVHTFGLEGSENAAAGVEES